MPTLGFSPEPTSPSAGALTQNDRWRSERARLGYPLAIAELRGLQLGCHHASAAMGIGVGDWALVTNNLTGAMIWALCGDFAEDNPEGEISEAAAAQLGIQFYNSGN
jgi:hypothetical protein